MNGAGQVVGGSRCGGPEQGFRFGEDLFDGVPADLTESRGVFARVEHHEIDLTLSEAVSILMLQVNPQPLTTPGRTSETVSEFNRVLVPAPATVVYFKKRPSPINIRVQVSYGHAMQEALRRAPAADPHLIISFGDRQHVLQKTRHPILLPDILIGTMDSSAFIE